jgi:hypothetical protein
MPKSGCVVLALLPQQQQPSSTNTLFNMIEDILALGSWSIRNRLIVLYVLSYPSHLTTSLPSWLIILHFCVCFLSLFLFPLSSVHHGHLATTCIPASSSTNGQPPCLSWGHTPCVKMIHLFLSGAGQQWHCRGHRRW